MTSIESGIPYTSKEADAFTIALSESNAEQERLALEAIETEQQSAQPD